MASPRLEIVTFCLSSIAGNGTQIIVQQINEQSIRNTGSDRLPLIFFGNIYDPAVYPVKVRKFFVQLPPF